jgi:hypothetical protein
VEETMSSHADQVILSFVEMINNGDIEGIQALLAPNHTFIDLEGKTHKGAAVTAQIWRDYLSDNPDYKIFVRQAYQSGDRVVLIGHTTGSHLNLPEIVEFHTEGVIWIAHTRDDKVTAWQILEDTLENYKRLALESYNKLFKPSQFAETIAKHLDLLPPGARTEDVRDVRIFYSRLYKDAQPEDMILLAEKLLFQEGYRFVPYELIYHHPGAIESLTPEKAITLGRGINDWSSADVYARFIAGPAWKSGILSDDHIQQWIRSEEILKRRAAVVSTIYLDGDVERMIRYTKMLLDDREDLVIKALAWVLRSAIQYDRDAVIDFIKKHENHLSSRIKREVNNKLAVSLKNP